MTTNGYTPLHLYCKQENNNNIEIVKLLKTTTNLKLQNNYNKMTPLMIYLKHHKYNINDDIVLELLNIENVGIVDNDEHDSFYYYCQCEYQTDIVKNVFINLPINLATKIYDELCSIYDISIVRQYNINDLMNIPICVKNCKLPEHNDDIILSGYISTNNYIDINILKVLLTANNLNYTNKQGNTPLHLYCEKEVSDINIIKLLKTKKNLKLKNNNGLIPLMVYLENHKHVTHIDIVSDSKSVIKCYKYLKTFIIVMIKT